ncbi:FAD-binding oxidoreductase [Patescibacteria group bacterium]|nr:FAD-binding oxidoreductase [Patescibacteria group bacterium]
MTTTWRKTVTEIDKPALQSNVSCDVAIVGGGITGITTAYLLTKAGKKVVLIEKDDIRGDATAHTTAFLTHVIDTDLQDLIKIFGKENAHNVWQSHKEAIDQIEKIIQEEKIDCEFTRCPGYIFSVTEKDDKDLITDIELANELGFKLTHFKDEKLPFKNEGYALVPNQAKFHPLKYLFALQEIAEKHGAQFFEQSCAEEVTQQDDKTVIVKTTQGSISATHVVIATYDPFNHPKELFAHKGPYVSYILDIEFPKGVLVEGLYEDTNNPYNYFRIDPQETFDRMILGGADHRKEVTMDPEKNFNALRDYFKTIFPQIEYKEANKWYGPILEPTDGLAYIGRFNEKKPNQLVAMGFSGTGMTYSMISACMFRDMIEGKKNAWEELYDPRRIPTFKQLWQKGVDYVGEFFGGAAKNIFKSKKVNE